MLLAELYGLTSGDLELALRGLHRRCRCGNDALGVIDGQRLMNVQAFVT